jgi:hypothetical protein
VNDTSLEGISLDSHGLAETIVHIVHIGDQFTQILDMPEESAVVLVYAREELWILEQHLRQRHLIAHLL